MSNREIGLVVAGAVLASAFGSAVFAQTQEATATRQEPVMSFRATGDMLRFQVATGGCTTSEDFDVGVRHVDGQAQVTLTRRVPDNCKGNFPEGEEIAISYEAAGLNRSEPVRLLNRVQR